MNYRWLLLHFNQSVKKKHYLELHIKYLNEVINLKIIIYYFTEYSFVVMKSILFRSECVICLTLCNIIQHCHSISGKRYCLAQLPGILIWYDLLLGSNSVSQVENFKSLIWKKIISPTKKKKIKNNRPLAKEKKTENPQNIFSNQCSEWTISGIVYLYDSSK